GDMSGQRLALAAGFALLAVLGVAGPAPAAETRDAPDYEARLLDSEQRVDIADMEDEVLLLNTWATWCEPCREEMPDFEAIHQRYADQGLRVVGVNIDEGRGDGSVRRFVDSIGVSFEIWRDPRNHFGKAFRVLGPPETFLVSDGRILRHWRGQMNPGAPENLSSIEVALGLRGADEADAGATVATAGLLVAFGAGLISVLSPCVLPLIPSYASVVAAVRLRQTRKHERQPLAVGTGPPGATATLTGGPEASPGKGVAVRAGFAFVGGFSAVFMALGVLVNRAGAALADNRIWLTRFGGVVLVVLGLHLIGVLRVRAAEQEKRFLGMGGGRGGYLGAFLVGVAFAAGWSPCIGPVLAGILTLAASGGSTYDAAVLLGAYCAGLAVPFLTAALALDRFLAWSAGLRRSWLPVAERVSGALVLGVGVLLLTGVFSRLAEWAA
ncbi:MAG: cytochrome c biogenesis protein CcdA, partial [Acidimicrobiia bacterium]